MYKVELSDLGGESVKEQAQEVLTEHLITSFYSGMPARVVGNNNYETQQVVDVVPVIDEVYPNGDVVPAPTLKSVFVQLPAGGGFSVNIPLQRDDLVTLIWPHKQIGTFLDGTGENITQSNLLTQTLGDCWCIPGFGTRKNNQSPSKTDFVIKSNNTTLTIKPDGTVNLVTSGETTVDTTKATFTGDLNVAGTITAPNIEAATSLKAASAEVVGHVHGGVTSGGANTAPLA